MIDFRYSRPTLYLSLVFTYDFAVKEITLVRISINGVRNRPFHPTESPNNRRTKLRTALLIVDHGSVHEDANTMLNDVASLLRRQRPNLIVEIAHMELAHPTIKEGIDKCALAGATKIVVHPYMLSPGRHATQDVPRIARESLTKYPEIEFKIVQPLGLHEKIAEVVLERAGL